MSGVEIERRIRWYQQPLHSYLVNTPAPRAIEIAHRRWGKDEVVLAAECELAHNRIGTYWHCLPEYAQARKALWTAVNAHTGNRLIGAEAQTPEAVAAEYAQDRQDHPIASVAGGVAGTVLPLVAVGGLPGASRLLGTEGGLLSRAGFGAVSGATVGGVDAQRAVQRARGMLDIPGNPGQLDPHPGALLETRHALDDMIAKAVPGTNEAAQLVRVRGQVDNLLGQAAPGIKDVDAQYAELARQSEALRTGQQLLDSGRTAVRPAELADMMQEGALPQGTMVGPSAVPMRLAQGTRAEIDRIVGTTTNDLNALKTALKGDGSWNRDRLAQLYGSEKADRLMGLLDREVTYDTTYNRALMNSATAERTAAQNEMSSGVTIPTSANLTGIIANVGSRIANAGVAMNSGATNSRVAAALMSRAYDLSPKETAILAALVKKNARGLIPPSVAGQLATMPQRQ